MSFEESSSKAFLRLLNIMNDLREKCPWDKKQTMESLRMLTIEETFELADAILSKDDEEIKKELGDLILHIIFYSKIASETNSFTIADVLNSICEKLIKRHPHIYGDTKVNSVDDVKKNWELIKLSEGSEKTVLSGVPKSLPSLVKAIRIQEKAKGVGFDWDKTEQVWDKVLEEMDELKEEMAHPDNTAKREEEYGDLLFALVNLGRFINVNPENALEKANKKFIRRFNEVEKSIKTDEKSFNELNLEQLEEYWSKVKAKEAKL